MTFLQVLPDSSPGFGPGASDVTRSLINVNEDQNEIFRGSAQSLEPLINIAETAIR